MNRNWKKYNKTLVRRGEIMLSFYAMESWSAELKKMNRGKEDSRCKIKTNYRCYHHRSDMGIDGLLNSVFSAFKRMFGEHVTSHKRENMIHELEMKVCLYNKMIAMH